MELDRVCLDTGMLIAYLKGREPGASALEQVVRQSDCYATSLTVYEVLFGVARARKQIGEEALLSVVTVVPFDESAARRAAQLHDQLIRGNQDIGLRDVLIAAVCLEHSLPLLTLNERHFNRVPKLRIVTPREVLGERGPESNLRA